MTPKRVAIIGGGPGGLMTAYLLERRTRFSCSITLFEASDRLGGKVITRQFAAAPVSYEAGAAELYDYSQLGPDPLRELVAELGLSVRDMGGETVIIGDQMVRNLGEVRTKWGEETWKALARFTRQARKAISPTEYYESDWKADNEETLFNCSFRALLDRVPDGLARRYIEVSVHSDLATEPENTNAMYGLQNYLMNEQDYMRLYTIDGGIERLTREVAKRLSARVLLNHAVVRVEKTPSDTFRLVSRHAGQLVSEEFDFVVVALPNNWIPAIDWGIGKLGDAMRKHHAYYDYPAHYLRVSILFDKPFWRDWIAESYFMLDAFGGCCVYDESSRSEAGGYGVLGWLLAGEAALTMSNFDDATLIARVLESLPGPLQHGKDCFVEGRVHRWVGSVNGLPGGRPAIDPDARHVPEPEQHARLFVVGDYLFDSTINGVLDSADVVAEWIVDELVVDPLAVPAAARVAGPGAEKHPANGSVPIAKDTANGSVVRPLAAI